MERQVFEIIRPSGAKPLTEEQLINMLNYFRIDYKWKVHELYPRRKSQATTASKQQLGA